MAELLRRIIGIAVPLAAVAVMLVGLWPSTTTEMSGAERAHQVASNLKCPFCQGESIADSTSQVARDLRAIIAEQVAEGRTDQQIHAFFVQRYGEQVLLDPPSLGWGAALWALPLLAVAAGVAAILGLRRQRLKADAERTAAGAVTAEEAS